MSALLKEEEIADWLRQRIGEKFDLAVVLGSGLGALADLAEESVRIDYGDIPGFYSQQIVGHAGRLVAGRWLGHKVLVFQGRFHLYQGFNARQVALPVRLAAHLGCRRLLLTNAVGGINGAFRAGDFMMIEDHINLMGDNPLRGETEHPFIDLSESYQIGFFDDLQNFARRREIPLHRGVLAAVMGPSYETPAEIRMLQRLGADAVSMSTVPETIMAKYLGMEVVGLSLVSNVAAGLSAIPLDHQEVLQAGRQGSQAFIELAHQLVSLWLQAG